MADPSAKTPIPHKNPNKNTHLKHMEKMGVKNNIPVENLLDEFLRTIRKHKRAADARHLPPDSKGPLGYLLEAKKKVKK